MFGILFKKQNTKIEDLTVSKMSKKKGSCKEAINAVTVFIIINQIEQLPFFDILKTFNSSIFVVVFLSIFRARPPFWRAPYKIFYRWHIIILRHHIIPHSLSSMHPLQLKRNLREAISRKDKIWRFTRKKV